MTSALDGRPRVGPDHEAAAVRGREGGGPRHDRRVRCVACRMGDPDLDPLPRRHEGERVEDVVPVADEGDDEPAEPPERLAQGEDVGQRLAGVLVEGEGVDHGDIGGRGQLHGDLVVPGPDDDPVNERLEVARDVGDRFADAPADIARGQLDGTAAELEHAGLERHPRPEAGPLEEHRQRPPDERRPLVAPRDGELGLEGGGRREHAPDLGGSEVTRAQQIPPAQAPRWGDARVRIGGRRHRATLRPELEATALARPVTGSQLSYVDGARGRAVGLG